MVSLVALNPLHCHHLFSAVETGYCRLEDFFVGYSDESRIFHLF